MKRYRMDLLLIFATILFIVIRTNIPIAGTSPAEACGFDERELNQPAAPNAVTITIWAVTHYPNCWRAFAPVEAAKRIPQQPIQVQATAFNTLNPAYFARVNQAQQAGHAPDIVYGFEDDIGSWAQRGYIIPLDQCIKNHSEFDDVDGKWWKIFRSQAQRWAVPIDASASTLFFNKSKLTALGWSQSQIDALPAQIRNGMFTLDDLLVTAKQAIDAGIVERGNGLWTMYDRRLLFLHLYTSIDQYPYDVRTHRFLFDEEHLYSVFQMAQDLVREGIMAKPFILAGPIDLWPSGMILRDALAHGKALFSESRIHDWYNYVDAVRSLGGEARLLDQIDITPFPSARKGKPGHALVFTYSFYAISSERASGRQNQEAACSVLAQTVTPEINALQTTKSGTLGASKQHHHPAYTTTPYARHVADLWDVAQFMPVHSPHYWNVVELLTNLMLQTQRQEIEPKEAARRAMLQLKMWLGSGLYDQ